MSGVNLQCHRPNSHLEILYFVVEGGDEGAPMMFRFSFIIFHFLPHVIKQYLR